MRKLQLNWKAGLLSLLVAAGMACPVQSLAAVKNVMCVKTNTGKYFPVVRVSMMVVPDGGKTFEIVLKDGVGEANVQEISFEKHEEDVDFNKYKVESDGTTTPDGTKKVYLLTSTGKYFSLGAQKPVLNAKDGSSLFDVAVGNDVEANVANVYFYRGDNVEEMTPVKAPMMMVEEKLTLMTPINQQMTISGCGDATQAIVYTTNGVKVGQATVSNGVTTVEVGNLTRGVYVVKVGNKALKFTKK